MNMTANDMNPYPMEDHSIEINKSMIGSPSKKIRAGRSVRADRAKSR